MTSNNQTEIGSVFRLNQISNPEEENPEDSLESGGWVWWIIGGIFIIITLCVIFTILVSFSRDNALFASKAKINVF